MSQAELAARFAARHRRGPIVVLPNAFDVATARLIARRDPVAIGTTSAAIAAIAGYPDGESIAREEMLRAIARIVAAVDVGVSADVEAGYGDEVEDARTIAARLLEIGVIGLNVQDTGHPSRRWAGGLLEVERAAAKIAAIREVADRAGVPLVINARTDAGADCVFAPGIVDRDGLARLVAGLNGPLNAYATAATPTVAELEALGVRRVSVGCGPYQACLALVDRATRELLESGRYDAFANEQLSIAELLDLTTRRE